MKKKSLSNFSLIISDKVLKSFFGLFVTAVVARYLKPENYGLLSYGISLVAISSIFVKLGFDATFKQRIINAKNDSAEWIWIALVLRLLAAFSTWLIMSVALYAFIENDKQKLILILLSTTVFREIFVIPSLYFHAKSKFLICIKIEVIVFLIFSFIKLFCVYNDLGLLGLAWAQIVEMVLLAIFYLLALGKKINFLLIRWFSWERAKSLIEESWPFIISGISVVVYMKSDLVMINYYLGEYSVGVYAASIKVISLVYFIPQALSSVMFPVLTKTFNRLENDYWILLSEYLKLNSLMSLVVCLFVFFLSEVLIQLIFGYEYVGSIVVLKWLSFSSLFLFMGVARSQFIVNNGLAKFAMVSTCIGATMNLILNSLWIPKYGIEGAAIASVCSQFISGLLSSFIYKKTRRFAILQIKNFIMPFPRFSKLHI